MALVSNILQRGLSSFMDEKSASFIKYPGNASESAQKWAKAISDYAKPLPAINGPGWLSASKGALKTLESGILSAIMGKALHTALDGLIMSYAISLAVGFIAAPMPGGVVVSAIPPIKSTLLAPMFATAQAGGSTSTLIVSIVTDIDSTFKTGTYIGVTPVGVPIGPLPWA